MHLIWKLIYWYLWCHVSDKCNNENIILFANNSKCSMNDNWQHYLPFVKLIMQISSCLPWANTFGQWPCQFLISQVGGLIFHDFDKVLLHQLGTNYSSLLKHNVAATPCEPMFTKGWGEMKSQKIQTGGLSVSVDEKGVLVKSVEQGWGFRL